MWPVGRISHWSGVMVVPFQWVLLSGAERNLTNGMVPLVMVGWYGSGSYGSGSERDCGMNVKPANPPPVPPELPPVVRVMVWLAVWSPVPAPVPLVWAGRDVGVFDWVRDALVDICGNHISQIHRGGT